MTGPYGGHSELGSSLNEIHRRSDDTYTSRLNVARATIHKSYKGQYVFFMKLLDNENKIVKITGPIPIKGVPEELVGRYGSPEEMENKWEVLITYKGTSVNSGIAEVTTSIGSAIGSKTEEVAQCNQLPTKGFAFAPPGAGV